jgi:4-hydroxy-4-methyl-2-oxoglutarate aldolase
MIGEPPPLTFAPLPERPLPAIVERFRGVPTSNVVDAMGGVGALDWRIRPIVGKSLLGVALTCDCGASDNLALVAAVAQAQSGDVIVAAVGGSTAAAVTGDLLIGVARNRGVVGFVTDGLVRDLDGLEALSMPIYALGLSPLSPGRRGPGAVGLPIVCGGRAVASGDVIVGDRDGVVVVPRDRIAETLERLDAVTAAEAKMLARVRAGALELPLDVAEQLKRGLTKAGGTEPG